MSKYPMAKYAQPILFFFCRPCGDYHEKAHPHYRAQKRRAAKRRKAKDAAQTEQQTQQQS
jgi:hypothetical protein